MKKNKNTKGQSLLEVLASLGAATVIVTAIVVAIINALNNAQYSKNQNLATQYAQEAMEIVRKKRDSDYAAYSALVGQTYCLDKDDSDLDTLDRTTNPPVGCQRSGTPNLGNRNINNFFARSITLTSLGSCTSGAEVIVSVVWGDGKCTSLTNPLCHTVRLQSCLTDYRVVPTP